MKLSRAQKVKLNIVTTLLNQLISTVCGILIPWTYINAYGSAAYGATTSIAQLLSYITLTEGGVGVVARAALYKPLAMNNVKEVNQVYNAVVRFYTMISAVFVGYTLILALVYHDLARVDFYSWKYTFFLVLVISIGRLAEYMAGIEKVTLFNADQKQYLVNIIVMSSNIFNAIVVVIMVYCGNDLLWVRLGSSIVFALKPFFYTYFLRKNYSVKRSYKSTYVLKNKWTGFGQHLAMFIQMNTDVLILTVCANLELVAVYSVYNLVVYSVKNIASSFTGGMEAVFGNMIAKNEYKELNSAFEKYKLLLFLVTQTLFGTTAVLIVSFVQLYTKGTTDADYVQPIFAILLILAYALNCMVLPCFNLAIAADKLKQSRWGSYGEALVNLVLSCILVWWKPLIGIAIGTFASSVFKCIFYMKFAAKEILDKKFYKLFRDCVICIIYLLTNSVFSYVVMSKLSITNYFVWGIYGVIFVGINFVCTLVLGHLLYPGNLKSIKTMILKK